LASAKPATRERELYEKINSAAANGKLSEFVVAGLRREVETLRVPAPVECFELMGHIEALLWNRAGVTANFDAALRLRKSYVDYARYSAALTLAGDFVAAFDVSKLASDAEKGDLKLLRIAITDAKLLGLHEEALTLLETYARRSPSSPHLDGGGAERLSERLKAMTVAQDLPYRCHKVALSLLTEKQIRVGGVRFELDQEQQSGGIYCFVGAEASAEILFELEDELAVRLFEEVPDLDLNSYWIGYEVRT
jgi:hypothetical protein